MYNSYILQVFGAHLAPKKACLKEAFTMSNRDATEAAIATDNAGDSHAPTAEDDTRTFLNSTLVVPTGTLTKKRKYIDLTGVPSQPLILKNELSRTGYADNSRTRPTTAESSRFTGVYHDRAQGKWKAQIFADGAVRAIGLYDREEDAAAGYARAAFKYKARTPTHTYAGLDLSRVPAQPLIRGETSSGYKGVKKNKTRWEARIATTRGTPPKTLGTFDTPELAAGIYARAAYYLERRGDARERTASRDRDEETSAPGGARERRRDAGTRDTAAAAAGTREEGTVSDSVALEQEPAAAVVGEPKLCHNVPALECQNDYDSVERVAV